MAITLKRTDSGSVSRITEVKANTPSNILSAVSILFGAFNSLVDAFNGRISLGSGESFSRAGNLDAAEVEWMTPSTPNFEFAIPHGLGRVPKRVERTNADRACDVYSSGTAWTNEFVYVKCSVASALVLLRIS